jgi:hypothetical protein
MHRAYGTGAIRVHRFNSGLSRSIAYMAPAVRVGVPFVLSACERRADASHATSSHANVDFLITRGVSNFIPFAK